MFLFEQQQKQSKLLNLSNFLQLEESAFIKHDAWEILKIPLPPNLFDNKTGQLRGERLESGFINITDAHLQHSELGTWTPRRVIFILYFSLNKFTLSLDLDC